MKRIVVIGVVLITSMLWSCENGGESAGYFFEDEIQEEEVAVNQPEQQGSKIEVDLTEGSGEVENYEDMPEVNFDSIPDYQDKEVDPTSIKSLIDQVLTDGKLDTAKVEAALINSLLYISKENLAPGFTCESMAYFGTSVMIPMPKNEYFASVYIPADLNGKRYHFILLNYRGYISGKNYVVECSRNDYSYKELFVFYPEEKARTQASLVLAISDVYLKDAQTLVNINWRVGSEEAEHKDYGVVQYTLKKQTPS